MKSLLILGGIILSTLAPSFAQAAPAVSGRVYSSTECHYFTGNQADFIVTLPGQPAAGTKVFLRYGFRNSFGQTPTEWNAIDEKEMNVSANGASLSLEQVYTASRGGYFYNAMEFVFRIVSPTGETTFDDGGSNSAYYVAALPEQASCVKSIAVKALPITIVKQ